MRRLSITRVEHPSHLCLRSLDVGAVGVWCVAPRPTPRERHPQGGVCIEREPGIDSPALHASRRWRDSPHRVQRRRGRHRRAPSARAVRRSLRCPQGRTCSESSSEPTHRAIERRSRSMGSCRGWARSRPTRSQRKRMSFKARESRFFRPRFAGSAHDVRAPSKLTSPIRRCLTMVSAESHRVVYTQAPSLPAMQRQRRRRLTIALVYSHFFLGAGGGGFGAEVVGFGAGVVGFGAGVAGFGAAGAADLGAAGAGAALFGTVPPFLFTASIRF